MTNTGVNKINEKVERHVQEEQLKTIVLNGFFTTFRDSKFAIEELIQYCDEMGYESIEDLINETTYAE